MPESGEPAAEELLQEIRDLHERAWASAAPPASEKDAQKLYVQNRFRQLGAELMERGVTLAMLEGTFLVWWLRLACTQRWEKGGFEFYLAHIGPLMAPVPQILERVYNDTRDAGPAPEMKELGEKLDRLKQHAGGWLSWPKSRDIAAAEQDRAMSALQALLLELTDEGMKPAVLESMLFYFWFRCTAIRRNLYESFFQKLERNWDTVMERMDAYLATLPEKLAQQH